MFTDDFLKGLPEDPVDILYYFANEWRRIYRSDIKTTDNYDNVTQGFILESLAFLESYSESYGDILSEVIEDVSIKENIEINDFGELLGSDLGFSLHKLEKIVDSIKSMQARKDFENTKSVFSLNFKKVFSYEFTNNDLARIQTLVNELRFLISQSDQLERSHQARLLRRLERLQRELHKRMSDLDRLWGLVGDAGVVLGKLGKDAQPLVERVREIANIVWQTQARAEELPGDASPPLLPSADDQPE